MRPDAPVRKQLDQRRADLARGGDVERIEHASAAGQLPNREQDRQGGKLAQPGVARIAQH